MFSIIFGNIAILLPHYKDVALGLRVATRTVLHSDNVALTRVTV